MPRDRRYYGVWGSAWSDVFAVGSTVRSFITR